MSLLTSKGNLAGRFSRKDSIPSLASADLPVKYIPWESILCASIGWSAPSIFHIICLISPVETAEVSSTNSRANRLASASKSSGLWRA